ncbi:MFS family permease [Amycolatopsis bartoniae]|uniref:MFS transporter n=1 Tax=Amycolatopsis bartoniae TaxID=941986 RepID=A0A8H9M7S9_9PSEU|nr:MFS transporter [Amycolatopsis bartoniae]MBB2935578.1 MFS family permease [Amycolatopsis bartoniae]TVT05237.1 MFS transporter [Amycolatopsis bartoniae]GHF76850.1 MFS transporter [Amycolatopsis bartoniae]
MSRWKISAHPVSWLTLLVTSLAILITSLDAAILPSVLPQVKEAFGLNDTQAGAVNSVFFVSTIAGALLFGWLSDIVGNGYRRSWVWIAAMALSVVGGVFTFVLASSWVAFQLMRVVMGISRGGSEPTNVAIVGEWWQVENRGFAVGAHHIGFPLGQFFAPALVAALLGATNWQTTFLVLPLIGVPIMIAQARLGTRRNQQKVYDWISERGLTPPLPSVERGERAPNPLRLLKGVLRVANVRRAILLNFGFLWCELGLSTFLVVYLTDHTTMSTGTAILASGASGLTGWIGQIGWGTVSDHLGRKRVLLVCVAGWVVTVVPLLAVGSAWQAWVLLLLWGLFRNAPYPVIYSLVIDSAPGQAGSAMGLMIAVTTGLGGAIVSTVAGFAADHWGWGWTFVLLVAGPVLALVPLLRIRDSARARVAVPA